jgi:cytochrome c oxidase subunit 2
MYIGHDNSWSFIPTREGHYEGKCAELCGEYHSMMLFNVEVVSQSEYDAYIAGLEADGQVGDVNEEYNRLQNLPGTDGVEKDAETEEGN